MPETSLNEEARWLRNLVYPKPVSDKEWAQCGPFWERDIEWLRRTVAEDKARETKAAK